MERAALLEFIRAQKFAVQASVSASNAPQAAVVGIVVTDAFEVFFDTLDVTRKAHNLRMNPKIAFVIGGCIPGDERTVQYEGIADEPRGDELARLQALYFESFPDGHERQRWPGLIYIRARPIWIRYSDYNCNPAQIVQFDFEPSSPAARCVSLRGEDRLSAGRQGKHASDAHVLREY